MQPYLETHVAARAVLVATVVASPLLEGAVTALDRSRSPVRAFVETTTLRTGRSEQDRGTKWMLVGAMVVGFLLAWQAAERFPGAAMPGSGTVLFTVGLLIVWAGVAIRLWSVATLGRFFRRVVVIQEGQTVVSSGPYRFVRHPSYLGNLLAAAGFGLALGNWISLAILVVIPTLGHLPRIRVEERTLGASLGDDYTRYAAGRKRLVPGVW